MKYIPQFLYILSFSFIGEILQKAIPLPIPASIYGMVLMLTLIIKTVMPMSSS